MKSFRRFLKKFFSNFKKHHYRCRHCGYILAKKNVKISGWGSARSSYRIHCPKCRKIITYLP